METLVTNDLKSTTRAIAQHFNRRHADILRAVDNFKNDSGDEDFNQRNFALVEYLDSKGENRKTYSLTEEAALILVGRMTGKGAAKAQVKIAQAFVAMKRVIKSQRVHNEQQLRLQLESVQDKAAALETILADKANTLAKLLNIAPSKSRPYFEKLEALGLVNALPKVINGFVYKPTSQGLEYIQHVDKNGIIHWKPEVLDLLK